MREQPILFSGSAAVRTVLAGIKTADRRPVTYLRGFGHVTEFHRSDIPGYAWQFRDRRGLWNDIRHAALLAACPFGRPGDRLWVREKWRIGAWDENEGVFAIDYCDGPRREWVKDPSDIDGQRFETLWIECCDELSAKGVEVAPDGRYYWEPGESQLCMRSPIHMPRWASRITLDVTGVRIERLQDISEADCRSEGIRSITKDGGRTVKHGVPDLDGLPGTDDVDWPWSEWQHDARGAYRRLWESLHGPTAWDANPWVWVLEFKSPAPAQAHPAEAA